MSIQELRARHPRFVYKSYNFKQSPGIVTITYDFFLEPDIWFHPTVTIPAPDGIDAKDLDPYVFQLGMIESISYWKAACSSLLLVEAGSLSLDQIAFWKDLFMHGLGKFYYVNAIDFTVENFLTIQNVGNPSYLRDSMVATDYTKAKEDSHTHQGDLVLVGGGKDSAVTLALLDTYAPMVMAVNPTKATRDIIAASGISNPIFVRRYIDPRLLELNTQGYLNGHTPFSAYLSFLGSLVARIYKLKHVIVSNERSANEGNVIYHGIEINHQYSKSIEYEIKFRKYYQSMFKDNNIEYFSFLRPLNDLRIAKLFSTYPKYFSIFRSCNVGSKTNTWCGDCPKCAFTYIILSPFLSQETLRSIFGQNVLENPNILDVMYKLAGLKDIKPFECVGTHDEVILAIHLAIERMKVDNIVIHKQLEDIYTRLALSPTRIQTLMKNELVTWGIKHAVPFDYVLLLQQAWLNTSP